MPISREAFETTGDPLPQLVLDLLRANLELALTVTEILAGLVESGIEADTMSIEAALAFLIARDRVRSREVVGETYFTWNSRIGFRS